MAAQVKPIPQGYHSVTPYLVVNDAAKAVDYYKRAFGAKEIMQMKGPQGKISHAEIKIGDSIVMLSDEMPEAGNRSAKSIGGSPVALMVYVEDVDKVFQQAISAGAHPDQQPTDMFWGDRYGKLTDPFGHLWSIATHKEDVAPAEMEKRAQAAAAKTQQQTRSAS